MWPKQLARLMPDQRPAAIIHFWLVCLVTRRTAAGDDSLVGTIILAVDCRLNK